MTNIGAITKSIYFGPMIKGAKKFGNDYLNFVFGVDQSEKFSQELAKTVRGVKSETTKKYEGGKGFVDFKQSVKDSWTKSKEAVVDTAGKPKSFGTVLKDSFKAIGEEFKGLKGLKLFGKEGKLASTLKILGKRMPLIGNVLMVAFEAPNIAAAFTDKKDGGGIITGTTEVVKTGAKLGAFAAGAAIGQAVIPIPFIGGLIGGIVGSAIADKILGKSFTEKKEEAKAAVAEKAATGQVAFSGSGTETTPATTVASPTTTPQYGDMANNSLLLNSLNKKNILDEDIMAMGAGLVKA